MGFANIINTIRKLDKFIVIRVHGKVVGGGVGIVAACDYAIANENAFVKLSELSIGIGPFVIEPAISRKIGKQDLINYLLILNHGNPQNGHMKRIVQFNC